MKICFISDYFEKEFPGGAEMSLEALVETSPYEIIKINSKQVTDKIIEENKDNFWIFGNYTFLDLSLDFSCIKYSVIEFDYKFCQLRQPCMHWCNCAPTTYGKRIFKFLLGATIVWFMSYPQQQIHLFCCDSLNSLVLSAPFRERELLALKEARNQNNIRSGWHALGAGSWQKGLNNALKWGEQNNVKINLINNIPHNKLLYKLSTIEGLIYLPNGYDTCPRLVTEAKLAGCKLQTNNYVQQIDEDWFNSPIENIENYLLDRPKVFWNKTMEMINGN